jgi:uncharacterized protein (UPF0303 family)
MHRHKNDLYIAVLNDDVWFRLYRLKNADTWALGKKVRRRVHVQAAAAIPLDKGAQAEGGGM